MEEGKDPVWVERTLRGPFAPATEGDKCWLKKVWENAEDYGKVHRFPREGNEFSVPLLELLTWEEVPRFDPGQVAKTRWLIDSFLAEKSIQLVFGEREFV